MKSLKIIALAGILAALTGCSGACKSLGQAPGAFSGSTGWTGIANIGITGIQAGICGAGVMLEKAQQGSNSDNGNTETEEKKQTIADKDMQDYLKRMKE